MKASGIKRKVTIMTAIAMGLLTIIISAIGYFKFDSNVLQKYVKYAEMVVNSASTIFEKNHMGDMIKRRAMDDNYEDIRLLLNEIKDNSDIKYLYAVYFEDPDDIKTVTYAINAKNKEELSVGGPIEDIYSYMGERCEEDAFQESTLKLFQEALRLNDDVIRYEESETSVYGRLVICYKVIRDNDGDAVGIVAGDIDVNNIRTDIFNYLTIVLITAFVITVMIILIFITEIDAYITSPINSIAHSTDEFVKLMQQNVNPEDLVYKKTKVKGKDEIQLLANGVESLADGVKNYLDNLRSVTKEKERIGAELSVATHIQADMLPRIFPAYPNRNEFDLFATMTPAKEVGGDFYDFFLVDDDHLGLVIADVSGKGVPAALFMVIAKTLIKNAAQLGKSPSEILSYANEHLCEGNEAELFVTVWIGIIDINTGKGIAANAGHEHPALKRANGDWELVVYKHSPAVATMEGMKFKEHEFEIHPGDTLYVYTDGVTEATNANNELFGEERLIESLNKNADLAGTPEKLLKNVREDIDAFVGDAPQFDDITMLSLHWFG